MFSSKSFTVSGLTFRSLIHFEFTQEIIEETVETEVVEEVKETSDEEISE